MPGTSALHMAASPTEDNTVRTKTATPDWYSWGIFRPFPRSHTCRKKKRKKKKKEERISAIRALGTLLSEKGAPPHWKDNSSQHGSREKHFSWTPPFSKPTTWSLPPSCPNDRKDRYTKYSLYLQKLPKKENFANDNKTQSTFPKVRSSTNQFLRMLKGVARGSIVPQSNKFSKHLTARLLKQFINIYRQALKQQGQKIRGFLDTVSHRTTTTSPNPCL